MFAGTASTPLELLERAAGRQARDAGRRLVARAATARRSSPDDVARDVTGPSAERRAPRVQPARRVAYEVLRAVREDDAYANLLLPDAARRGAARAADAGLATELAYGTLRLRGLLRPGARRS